MCMCFNCAGRVELHLFSPWGGGEEEGGGGWPGAGVGRNQVGI